MTPRSTPVLITLMLLVLAACGRGERPSLSEDQDPSSAGADGGSTIESSSPPITTLASVPAPNGRFYPALPSSPADLAAVLARVETALREASTPATDLPDLGHTQQMIYRIVGRNPELDVDFFNALPPGLVADVADHLDARRAFIDLVSDFDAAENVPAWAIVAPEPLESLLAYYQEAEAATGIEWEYLAAINLVETGMGRIVGLSTAGARGPMQFIATTWDEVGEGSIDDPHDSIQAAARYLVRRGGPDDMDAALWGYNNADEYVTAVSHYAAMLRRDPLNLTGLYHWEIHFFASVGDLWLPAGYRFEESTPATEYLTIAPWSAPPGTGQ